MPTESEYGDDIRLLDDLTRLKLKLIDKKLKPNASPRHHYNHHRRSYTPDYTPTPPLPPERRRDRFYRKIDKRNELLQKLWEELGNGGSNYPRRHYPPSLPPLTPRDRDIGRRPEPHLPWMEEHLWNKTGNTKKDLMELMLIQNAQMQQWMMTQTLQKREGLEGDGRVHNHYYDAAGRALPPIRRADAGSQYPQDFFPDRGFADSRDRTETREVTPSRSKNRRRR